MESKKLSLGTKLGFGIGDIGGNMLFQIMGFHLMFYLTDTVGLSSALAGTALMIGKIWDAVTDPAMGYISDRTKSRMGRRRPYLLAGAVLAFIAMVVMFFNPHIGKENEMLLFVWAIGAFCLLCLAFTIFNVPYSALTPELTSDYQEITSVNGFRMFFALIGTLIGAGVFPIFVSIFTPEGSKDSSQGYLAAGIITGLIIASVTLITFFSIKEKKREVEKVKTEENIFVAYLKTFKNKSFVFVLFAWVFNMVGITIISAIMNYYFTWILGDTELTKIALFILIATAMGSMAIWVKIIKRLEKKIAYAIGLGILGVVCLIVFFFAEFFGVWFMFVMVGIAGIGLAVTYVSPWSMVADTIEEDHVRTGKKKEGTFYGLWTLISKIGQAIAFQIMGIILFVSGYIEPEKGQIVVQPESALTAIKFLLGPVPFIVLITGIVIVLNYPLNAAKYDEIRKQADAMK
ncbi:MAG: MFS transporter [Spirochaetales bacterium]|nr:MFS transporter [Spirochaetales bacterium]